MKFLPVLGVTAAALVGFLPFASQAAEWPVSASESDVRVTDQIPADGYTEAKVTVIVRDRYSAFLGGKSVLVQFSRGDGELVLSEKKTEAMGRAEFSVRSTAPGTIRVTVIADGIQLNDQPSITFVKPADCALGMARNISLQGANMRDTTYFYGRDCLRHAFPEHAYDSWYADAPTDSQPLSAVTLAGIKMGTAVHYRPGTLIRFQDSPRVYVATAAGVLRPIADEATAIAMFGEGWFRKVKVISVGYFVTSVFGNEIRRAADLNAIYN
jgi:hypothetical protein